MTTTTLPTNPDSQTIRCSLGGSITAALQPKVPITNANFDCTGFSGSSFSVTASQGSLSGTNVSVPCTLNSAGPTGINITIQETDIVTLVSTLGVGTFPGYINWNNGSDQAMIWAGSLQISANQAQINQWG